MAGIAGVAGRAEPFAPVDEGVEEDDELPPIEERVDAPGGPPPADVDVSLEEEIETTLDQVRPSTTGEEFDQTFRITPEAHPVPPRERPAVPFPWQGLPRIALVYNFNFVWDETAQEWVRQNPFSGGGAAGQGGGGFLSSAFSIGGFPPQEIPLDTELYDTGAVFDPATGDITIPEDGIYLLDGRVSVSLADDNTDVISGIHVNGSRVIGDSDTVYGGGAGTQGGQVGELSGSRELVAGDVVDLRAWQNSGSAVSLTTGEPWTYLTVIRYA